MSRWRLPSRMPAVAMQDMQDKVNILSILSILSIQVDSLRAAGSSREAGLTHCPWQCHLERLGTPCDAESYGYATPYDRRGLAVTLHRHGAPCSQRPFGLSVN